MMKKFKYSFLLVLSLVLSLVILNSCTADDEITKEPVSEDHITKAHEILKDSIVLNATAMMGTVNKTLLDKGCPLKYYLEWKGNDTLNVQIKKFCVGKMPVVVWFSANCKFMKLNSWEKEEYSGSGWVKFQARGGQTYYTGNENDVDNHYESGEGGSGSITGYLNVDTKMIEFVTYFGVMNMSSDVYPQEVDPSRMERFDEEFAQYEKDLAEYKKEHGIS